jgi:mycothiol synthase
MTRKIIIRNYCSPDFNRYLHFHKNALGDEEAGLHVLSRRLTEHLDHPACRPGENIFVALENEKIAGICKLTPEFKIGRLLVDIRVHPEFSRIGVGSDLLAAALARGRELGVYMLHANVTDSDRVAKSFLKKHVFKTVRRYYELHLDLQKNQIGPCDPAPFTTVPLQAGQEHRLTMMQNYFFKESWGFNPNTVEEVRHEIGICGCSHEDIILTFDGRQPVGYCWTRVDRDKNALREKKTGRIHMIGVNPKYRGGGLGKITLTAGLCRLKDQGLHIAELTTDSRNTAAKKLYESMGFKRHRVLLWYEKVL